MQMFKALETVSFVNHPMARVSICIPVRAFGNCVPRSANPLIGSLEHREPKLLAVSLREQ